MGAPKVTLREIDLSTRVPSFPGVYGAMLLPNAKKGTLDVTLITSDADLLKYYTPDGEIKVGYDNSYFSALAYLQGSDKLWVKRVVSNALYGGVEVLKDISTDPHAGFPTGDPSDLVAGAGQSYDELDHTFLEADALFAIYGANPGAWNNDVSIKMWNYHVAEPLLPAAFTLSGSVITVADPSTLGTTGARPAPWCTGDDVKLTISATSPDTATLPAILTAGTTYYVIRTSNTEIELATSLANALAGTAITFNDQGTATGSATFVLQAATEHCKEVNSFAVDVYYKGALQEQWICSKDNTKKDGYGSNIYLENILQGSNYIRGLDNIAVSGYYVKTCANGVYLASGDDGSAVTDGNMILALDDLASDTYPITLIMDGGWATTPYHRAIDGKTAARMDCMGILSVPYDKEATASYLNDIVNYRKVDLNLNSSFSALYAPHVKIYDKYNDRYLYVAPDGYAGAAISKTASNYEIWYPPAGFKRGMLNVLDLRRRFSSGEMDYMYDNGVNPLRFVPGKGILIWGQKTLYSAPSALDRINVRMLLIVIEPAIKEALQYFIMDLNTTGTQAIVKSIIDSYMNSIKSRKGVYDFYTVCDSSNNTAEDIDNHQLNVDLYIKPVLSVEFIRFSVIITRTGTDFKSAAAAV